MWSTIVHRTSRDLTVVALLEVIGLFWLVQQGIFVFGLGLFACFYEGGSQHVKLQERAPRNVGLLQRCASGRSAPYSTRTEAELGASGPRA